MKTLIENSIKILTVPGPMTTIFTPEDQENKHPRYISLTRLSGTKHSFSFNYLQDNEEFLGVAHLTVPDLETEEQIKNFIIDQIIIELENL